MNGHVFTSDTAPWCNVMHPCLRENRANKASEEPARERQSWWTAFWMMVQGASQRAIYKTA